MEQIENRDADGAARLAVPARSLQILGFTLQEEIRHGQRRGKLYWQHP